MSLAPFDVVVVPFPYSDVLAEKRRPAVVVSLPAVEDGHGRVWLAMITSATGPLRVGDAPLEDLAAAGLGRACRVRGAKIAVLDAPRVLRRTGSIASSDREAVRSALAACAAF